MSANAAQGRLTRLALFLPTWWAWHPPTPDSEGAFLAQPKEKGAGRIDLLAASPNISYDFVASTTATGGGVMHKLGAIKILEIELAAIEQEHHAELAGNEGMRDQADAKAEVKALAAVFDFLRDCKIPHGDSLLRILERYLRRKSGGGQGREAPVTQGAKGILAGIVRAQKDAGLKKNKAANWVTGRDPNSRGRGPRTDPKAHRIRPK
jgi:hypothetical protein